ncbi:MAG TPA: ABC transporter permease [Vicinamibacteria bacterium]
MRYLPLLFANLLRRKVRTILTLGSFAVALFLFCLLLIIRGGFMQGVEAAGADRLLVINKVSLIQPLPIAYRDRLLRVPGVKEATWANWFGGVYRDEKNFFAQFAIDHQTYRNLYTEFVVPDDQWRAFLADKQGAIVGKVTAERYGFKIGDRVPIQGAAYPGEWQFNVVGIYTGTRPQDDLTQFWFRWDYLRDQAPPWAKDVVGWYTVRVAPGADAVQVSRAIDEAFANSAWETRAQSEAAFMASFVEQMGNIEFLMASIGAVVFFTLLLVTGNTMAIAVRERTGELAVLKTVGFSDASVLALVLTESVLVALLGGGAGILLAELFTLGGDPTRGLLASFYLPGWGAALGIGLSLLVGLLAGALPAWSAMRLQVVEALRRL